MKIQMRKTGLMILLFGVTLYSCNGQEKSQQKEAQLAINKTSKSKTSFKTIELTKADFLKKVANYEANPNSWIYLGDKPAIIDFYATWCGPCKVIAPILDELAEEYKGEIYIYKIDTDKEKELAAMFKIRSIPSLLFIPMNGQPQMAQGALPKETFKTVIDSVLLLKK